MTDYDFILDTLNTIVREERIPMSDQNDINTETNPVNIVAAFAKARAEFPPILKDSVVDTGKYRFQYASLDAIMSTVVPALSKHGLAVTSRVIENGDVLMTSLHHASGECWESSMRIPAAPDLQRLGSHLTYLRRYAICCLLGITAETDDDGNAGQAAVTSRAAPAAAPPPPPPPAPSEIPRPKVSELRELAIRLKSAGVKDDERLTWLRDTCAAPSLTSSRELTVAQYDFAMAQVAARIRANAEALAKDVDHA